MDRIKWFSAVRVFGLFLILGYHLFYDFIPGGFLGVDVFFTFSGFLITAIILEEVRKKGGFMLYEFYKRRIRRILIPLFISIALTLPFALLISPDFTVGIGKQIAAALSFTSNWYNIISKTSYEARLLPSMYIHMWSLAVEMQFYIAWGFVCAIAAAAAETVSGGEAKKRYDCFKNLVLVISAAAAACCFIYMQTLHAAKTDLNFIYFNTLTRFFPLFIGSAAAAVWGMNAKRDEMIKRDFLSKKPKLAVFVLIAGSAGAAALIVFNFAQYKFEDAFIYRYGFLFTPLLTVLLIYAAHALHILTPKKTDEPRVLKAAADMSYDIYLFHWPFYIVFSALILNQNAASLITLLFTLIFSAFTFYAAERVLIPQNKSAEKIKKKRFVSAAVWAFVLIGAAAGGAVVAKAPPLTSIESSFAAGHIIQDTKRLGSLKCGIEAINEKPVAYSPLPFELLPEPATEPATEPETEPATEPKTEPPTGTPAQEVTEPTQKPSGSFEFITGGVIVIGDSVPLGAQASLINTIPECYVDAAVSRGLSEGADILRDIRDKGELCEYVVVALGTNGTYNYVKWFTEIIDALEPGCRLILVTPYDGRANENSKILTETAAWLRELPDLYDYITIADWAAVIEKQVNLLAGDRVHLGGLAAMQLYTGTITDAINAASQKAAK